MNRYESPDEQHQNNRRSYLYLTLVLLSQVLVVATIITVFIWTVHYKGGFEWSTEKVFNYHPLFMTLSLVLYGEAILVYRVFPKCSKLYVKVLHAILHILAFFFGVIGIRAVFVLRGLYHEPNMYSLHSWTGIAAMTLFALQWVSGLVSFLVPNFPERLKARYLPTHVIFGNLMFIFFIGVAITGINKLNFNADKPNKKNYALLLASELTGNILGVILMLFGGVVFYLVQNPDYKRRSEVDPETIALRQ